MSKLNKMINSVVYRYRPMVDEHEVKDLRQEARISILGINVETDPGLAYNTARAAVVDYLRKRARFNRGVDFYSDKNIENQVNKVADSICFEDKVDTRDFFTKVVDKIPVLYKDILLLYFVEEQTQHDIAKKYNKSQFWACKAIKMALKEIKSTIECEEFLSTQNLRSI